MLLSGSNQPGNDASKLPKVDEHFKLNKCDFCCFCIFLIFVKSAHLYILLVVKRPPKSNILAVQSTNLPMELKCSLCTNFFKDAVMIPCCQHSFCEKCEFFMLKRAVWMPDTPTLILLFSANTSYL